MVRESLKRTHNIQNFNLSEIKTVWAMLGVLLIAQKKKIITYITYYQKKKIITYKEKPY